MIHWWVFSHFLAISSSSSLSHQWFKVISYLIQISFSQSLEIQEREREEVLIFILLRYVTSKIFSFTVTWKEKRKSFILHTIHSDSPMVKKGEKTRQTSRRPFSERKKETCWLPRPVTGSSYQLLLSLFLSEENWLAATSRLVGNPFLLSLLLFHSFIVFIVWGIVFKHDKRAGRIFSDWLAD